MKYIIKFMFVIIFINSCEGQNKDNSNNKNQIEELEKSLVGKWEKLTISKKDTIIYQPCDANNTTLIITKDSIKIDYGQEVISYMIINKILNIKNKMITYKLSKNLIIQCNAYNAKKVFWTINGTKDLFTDNGNIYKHVEQPCEECWGEDECNNTEEKPTKYKIDGDYSEKYELYFEGINYNNDNRIESLSIKIKNGETEQSILYVPGYWFSVPQEAITKFNLSKDIIFTTNGLEEYAQIIFGDFNFDKKEDFTIINYEGSNAGPQYSYFLQDKDGKFYKDEFLTNEVRFFPVEINNKEKYITISHPLGCCKISTRIYKKTLDGWKILLDNVEDIEDN